MIHIKESEISSSTCIATTNPQIIKIIRHIEVPIVVPTLDVSKDYLAYFINKKTGEKSTTASSFVKDSKVQFLFKAEQLHCFDDGEVLLLVYYEVGRSEGEIAESKYKLVDVGVPCDSPDPEPEPTPEKAYYPVHVLGQNFTYKLTSTTKPNSEGYYEEGSIITIEITPNKGYILNYWNLSGFTERITTPKKSFILKGYTSAWVYVGTEPVKETISVSIDTKAKCITDNTYVNVDVTGNGEYYKGDKVTLVCTIPSGYKFKKWKIIEAATEGGISTTKEITLNPYSFLLASKTIGSIEIEKEETPGEETYYTLTVEYDSNQCTPSISPNPTPNKGYKAGTEISVACLNYDRTKYIFKYFEVVGGDRFEYSIYKFNITKNTVIKVVLEERPITQYIVNVNNDGYTDVTIEGNGTYNEGASVTLKCNNIPSRKKFRCWVLNDSKFIADNPYTFTINSNISGYIILDDITTDYYLELKSCNGHYTVDKTPKKVESAVYPSPLGTSGYISGKLYYDSGTKVKVTCVPDNEYKFDRWNGTSNTDNPIEVTLNTNIILQANVLLEQSSDGDMIAMGDEDITYILAGNPVTEGEHSLKMTTNDVNDVTNEVPFTDKSDSRELTTEEIINLLK